SKSCRIRGSIETVGAIGQIRLVGAAAVVIGAAGAYRESERHRLQSTLFVARHFHPLDVRSEVGRLATDLCSLASRALGPQVAHSFSPRDSLNEPQARVAVAKAQARLAEQAALVTFHGKRDGRPGGNRVEPESITAVSRFQDNIAVPNAAKRAKR